MMHAARFFLQEQLVRHPSRMSFWPCTGCWLHLWDLSTPHTTVEWWNRESGQPDNPAVPPDVSFLHGKASKTFEFVALDLIVVMVPQTRLGCVGGKRFSGRHDGLRERLCHLLCRSFARPQTQPVSTQLFRNAWCTPLPK
jgi:hypothetical protein